jgi:hypothetical protein
MSEWNRGDIEMALALKRQELNRALQHKQSYDAEDHNLCLALVRYRDGGLDVFAAYSNDSVLTESLRIGLNLVPNLAGAVPASERFGCDGMAQHHTEPKLLNYLCAAPSLRQSAYQGRLPHSAFYRSVVKGQREQALQAPSLLKQPEEVASVTLVSEIDCCTTCRKYSIQRFRTRYPSIPLEIVQFGKQVRTGQPPQFEKVTVTRTT